MKEIKAVTIKKEKNLAWGGAIPRVGAKEENSEILRVFCNQVAKIYGVPSIGVNAQGGQPYLNKDGRLYLLNELRKGKSKVTSMKTEYIQFSTNIEMPSIAKRIIAFADGTVVEAIGEASNQSVKLSAVQQTLNMMAETRATNRAIWQAIAGDVWNRVATNLAKSKMPQHTQDMVAKAGSVSFEEVGQSVEVNQMFDEAVSKIEACKSVAVLVEYETKIKSSKKYSAEQKKDLINIIRFNIDVLNEKARK